MIRFLPMLIFYGFEALIFASPQSPKLGHSFEKYGVLNHHDLTDELGGFDVAEPAVSGVSNINVWQCFKNVDYKIRCTKSHDELSDRDSAYTIHFDVFNHQKSIQSYSIRRAYSSWGCTYHRKTWTNILHRQSAFCVAGSHYYQTEAYYKGKILKMNHWDLAKIKSKAKLNWSYFL